MSNQEQGIFQSQAQAASEQLSGKDGLRELQKRGGSYLDDRIIVYLLAAAAVGLCLVWATSSSAIVLYGSLGLTIALTIFWGLARIGRIDRVRRERELEARSFEARGKSRESDSRA